MELTKIEQLKKSAAITSIDYILPDSIIGVGTGSTVAYFIEALASIKHTIKGAVASSVATEEALKKLGIKLLSLDEVHDLDLYIDGADQINELGQMIKGGGGALTREKIISAVANKFICIADNSKQQGIFGTYPVPVEVIPMAKSYVARECIKLGGVPSLREGFITDNGNIILDVDFSGIETPIALEEELDQIVGVVTNGLFAKKSAYMSIISSNSEIKTHIYSK